MFENENLENLNAVELDAEALEDVSGGKGSSEFVKTTGNVHIRKKPDKDSASLGTVEAGVYLSYLGESKYDDRDVKWYKVNYNGKVGWVSSKYSKRK